MQNAKKNMRSGADVREVCVWAGGWSRTALEIRHQEITNYFALQICHRSLLLSRRRVNVVVLEI